MSPAESDGMSDAETELRAAVRAVKRAPAGKRRQARARVAAAIPNFVLEGHAQAEVIAITSLSRERVRKICRDAGIEAPPQQRAKGARPTAAQDDS